MPVLSRFNGIVVKMYFQQTEHNPPHVHVFYGGEAAAVAIGSGEILEGVLKPKVLERVRSWLCCNRNELLLMWQTQEFASLPPNQ